MTGDSRNRRDVERVAAVTVLLSAVVVLASLAGSWSPRLRGAAPSPRLKQRVAPPPLEGTPQPTTGALHTGHVVDVILILLTFIGVALLLTALSFLIRWLLARIGRLSDGGPVGAGETAGEELPGLDLPEMADAFAAAQRTLDEVRLPRDSVIGAWVALERAAAGSGIERPRSHTPSEFTADLLARAGCDDATVTTLLTLYLRARFSEHAVTDDDVVSASAALQQLADGVRLRQVAL